jgi:hypothetical protein
MMTTIILKKGSGLKPVTVQPRIQRRIAVGVGAVADPHRIDEPTGTAFGY